jgi:hypothetical protein
MKALSSLFVILLFFPAALFSQPVDETLQKVSEAIADKRWDQAGNLFREAVSLDATKAEAYYQKEVQKTCEACPSMAFELATYYKANRNVEKAYTFYKELTELVPHDVKYLSSCAELEVLRGNEQEALGLYQRILNIDKDNLAANIFVGNYYYFIADKEKGLLDKNYAKYKAPTRMQYAQYHNQLEQIVISDYAKAKTYLAKVLQLFPSTEIKKTLDKISQVESIVK